MLRTTCTRMSRPTRSPVRKVADLGWPMAGPVQASTSSIVISSACIWRITLSMENVPMRLAMKLGVSLAGTTPLPRRRSQISSNDSNFRKRLRPGDQLHQFHVARRIEEMRSGPVLLKIFGAAFGNQVDRQAGSIRSDNGAGLAHRFDAREK